MRLENFGIHSPIELQSGNLLWDLHNVSDFRGLELLPTENVAVMNWHGRTVPNHRNSGEKESSGISLRFKNLQFLRVGERDGGLPLTEDTCVSEVLKVDPAIEHVEPHMRTRRDWKPSDSFRLIFRFQSGGRLKSGRTALN